MSRLASRSFFLVFAVTFAAFYMPLDAQAAQLGRLDILSGNHQPLVAQIQLEKIASTERKGLVARLADRQAFEDARLTPSDLLAVLHVELLPGPTPDQAIVRITSTEPIAARFLDTLIEVSWEGGKLVREYTLPLERKAEDVVLPHQSGDLTNNSLAREDPTRHVVQKGDTLGALAQALVPQAATPEQAMAVLYQANPSAFIGGSIHKIREGAVLNVPDASAVERESLQNAQALLREHDDRLQAAMQRLADNPVPVRGHADTATASGRIEEKPLVPAPQVPTDQLKIGRTRAAQGSAADREDKANLAAEELLSKQKALDDANERIALLEKNVGDLKKLLALKSKAAATASTIQPAPQAVDGVADMSAVGLATKLPTADVLPGQSPVAVMDDSKSATLLPDNDKLSAHGKSNIIRQFLMHPWLWLPVAILMLAVMWLWINYRQSQKTYKGSFWGDPPSQVDGFALPPEIPVLMPDPALAVKIKPPPVQIFTPESQTFTPEKSDTAQKTDMLGELDDMTRQTAAATAAIAQFRDAARHLPPSNSPTDLAGPVGEPNRLIDVSLWQEIATKLDLAAAYIDIGDAEGAQHLLNEVLKRGDAHQVQKARELLYKTSP